MPELLPFRNIHYRIGKNAPDKLKQLVAPPYDVISEEEKLEMKKHPDNICHVILPETYDDAAKKLEEMINVGKLITEKDRCICIYGIDYIRPDTGEKVSRYGFVGLLKLVEIFPSTEGVIPHEATFRKFTEDRLKIIQKTDSNFSPIFTIYDGNGTAEKLFDKYKTEKPLLETIDRDGFTHKIWGVWKDMDVKCFQEIVRNNDIVIADGHHRYITSLRHSNHGGCNYIMALFIDFNDPGLIIYTSHRQIKKMPVQDINELIKSVKEYFETRKCQNLEELQLFMEEEKDQHVFGCYFKDQYMFFKLHSSIIPDEIIQGKNSVEWKRLNIPILHFILFKNCLGFDEKNVTYIKDVNKGIANVDDGNIESIFMINSTTLEEVQKITSLGEIMPQKSTYFYPKPLSGFIIHRHSDEVE